MKLNKIKKLKIVSVVLIIVVLIIIINYDNSVTKFAESIGFDDIFSDNDKIDDDSQAGEQDDTQDSPDETENEYEEEEEYEEEPDESAQWVEVDSRTGWSFVDGGGMLEQTINFDSEYADGLNKVIISRKWHFADMFEHEAGEGSVVWCLHDSNDFRCWHREDTSCIFSWLTEDSDSGCNYDGTSWRFFIGNNYAERLDCDWEVTLYVLI